MYCSCSQFLQSFHSLIFFLALASYIHAQVATSPSALFPFTKSTIEYNRSLAEGIIQTNGLSSNFEVGEYYTQYACKDTNIIIFELPVKKSLSHEFSHFVIAYKKAQNEHMLFSVKFDTISEFGISGYNWIYQSGVFIPIATSSLINNEFNTDPVVGGNPGTLQTCFANCMETAENIITDDLEGWIAWNYSPFVQIAVAIDCAWNCP